MAGKKVTRSLLTVALITDEPRKNRFNRFLRLDSVRKRGKDCHRDPRRSGDRLTTERNLRLRQYGEPRALLQEEVFYALHTTVATEDFLALLEDSDYYDPEYACYLQRAEDCGIDLEEVTFLYADLAYLRSIGAPSSSQEQAEVALERLFDGAESQNWVPPTYLKWFFRPLGA
ncbi:MAG TPA: hypothetical protein VLA04_03955 [Verrucomicrobiae bacterium]|nr:hypothetical protein [Verrucomicrobiae bacterium]